MTLPGIFVTTAQGQQLDAVVKSMDELTNKWTTSAARGECGWICSDCCGSDPTGMPDQCFHNLDWCTKIIQRDKAAANNKV